MHFSFSLFCRKLRQPKNSRQYLNIAKKSSARVASARVFREPLTGGEFQSHLPWYDALYKLSVCAALCETLSQALLLLLGVGGGGGGGGGLHMCVRVRVRARARARACVCVCVLI